MTDFKTAAPATPPCPPPRLRPLSAPGAPNGAGGFGEGVEVARNGFEWRRERLHVGGAAGSMLGAAFCLSRGGCSPVGF